MERSAGWSRVRRVAVAVVAVAGLLAAAMMAAPAVAAPPAQNDSLTWDLRMALPGDKAPVNVPIASWSWSATQVQNMGSQSSGAGVGKVSFQHMIINRTMDGTSPKLFTMLAAGQHFREVDLVGMSGGVPLITLQMGLVAISGATWSGTDGAAATEQLTLTFGAMRMIYGNPSAPNPDSGSWNRIYNNNTFHIAPAG